MPVIGHTANNGHLSFIYKLSQNDFLGTAADVVHPAYPFHLVGGFERFGHTLLLCHSRNDDFHTLIAGLVDLGKMLVQRSARKIVCIENRSSGYYAWLRGGESARKTANQALLRELVRLHEKYPALGLDSLYHMLKPVFHCSRGRVHRLMKAAGIHSQRKRAYKATTNSRHNCPIAPNLLQRQFTFSRPNQAWVGDITYIPTGEGWLYFAIVKDLCTKKIVGYAFSQRIDTQLTLDALNMAVRRERPAPGLIFHSDRGDELSDSYGAYAHTCRSGSPAHLANRGLG